MNRLVVLAACVCASSAQVLVGSARAIAPFGGVVAGAPLAAASVAPVAPVPVQQSHQFHAQDEFGQFTFGHAGGPSARTESRNAYGVTTGSFQWVDATGFVHQTNYVADPINGFQVTGNNLPAAPVAPAAPAVTPLAAPVFDLVGPAPVADTPEVAAAKAEFQAAFDAAKAAAASRKKRAAPFLPAALPAALPAPLPYNTVSAPATREAVLTTIKLNPGHATFYRVD